MDRIGLLNTVHSISAATRERAILLTGRHLTLFDIFPSVAELERAKDNKVAHPFELFLQGQMHENDDEEDESDDEEDDADDGEEEKDEVESEDEGKVERIDGDRDDQDYVRRNLDYYELHSASVVKLPSADVHHKARLFAVIYSFISKYFLLVLGIELAG